MEPIHGRHLSRSRAGTTITELMVAVVILSIGCLGLFGTFRYISISLNVSRAQTLAANLAQERVEVLKNYNYYGLLITTSTQYDTRFSPQVPYDTGNYPPENISIGNMNFTRYTYVTMADVTNGTINSVSSNYPDTGLKQMTVNVVWTTATGSVKKWTLTNLLENPNVNPLDATMSGNVFIAGGGGALAGAQVYVEQNPDWSGTTNAGGAYSFQVYHGSYTVRASSAGFYDTVSSMTIVSRGATVSTNLSLEKISTGTIAGTVWYNNDLVISQVVVSTLTKAGDGNVHNIEYVELFNPSPNSANLHASGDTWSTAGTRWVLYGDNTGGNYSCDCNFWATNRDVTMLSTYVAPGHYYLIANATSFIINGVNVVADAYYDHTGTTYPKYLNINNADTVALYHWDSGYFGDEVGWSNVSAASPPWYYWPAVPNGAGATGPGNPSGQQIVRVSSPVASMLDIAAYGRAYDSQNNQNDFLYLGAGDSRFVTPKNSASGTFTVISGKVPSGVVISASDPHSPSLTAFATTIASGTQNLSYVPFKLTGVTTGTYSVALSYLSGFPSAVYSQILSNVSITQNQTIGVPNAATSPTWAPANIYQVQLSSTPDTGFVKGTVTDPYNTPLNGITVQSGGYSKTTGTDGKYFMNVTSGTITLTANPTGSTNNSAYVTQVNSVVVAQGAIATQDYVLSLGAKLTGYCTTGTTPIPNQVVNATIGGNQVGSATSDATGVFTLRNVSTGTYTITPVLDMGQDANPNTFGPVAVTSTGTVFIGTFTISGAYGSIYGTVTNGTSLVTSGALIIASTNTISSSPPSIAASSAPAQTPYYMISSKADGTYALPVRGGSTYNLSAYVPTVSASGLISITTKTYTGIAVSVGGNVQKAVVLP